MITQNPHLVRWKGLQQRLQISILGFAQPLSMVLLEQYHRYASVNLADQLVRFARETADGFYEWKKSWVATIRPSYSPAFGKAGKTLRPLRTCTVVIGHRRLLNASR
jgi:hypothetical protein